MKKILIGVTGGFGTGKTAVAGMLAAMGGKLLDADSIAHEVIMPGGGVYKKIVSLFGSRILRKDRTIDRKRLAEIIFKDKKKRAFLNSLIHPEVMKRIDEVIRGSRAGIFILDVPLLIETGMYKRVDLVIVVAADRKKQFARCAKKAGLSRSEIEKRIRSQMPLSRKKRLADFIIDNNGPVEKTREEVKKVWREIETWQKKRR